MTDEIDCNLVPKCHTRTKVGVNEYICIRHKFNLKDCGFRDPHIIKWR